MNKSRLLWILVLADLMTSFASVGSEAFFGWTLPPELKTYGHGEGTGSWISGAGDAFQLLLLAVTCLFAFAAWISLVSYWRYARELYLVACATWLLLIVVSGPSVLPSVSLMFRIVNGMVGGLIISLVYFSDLAHRFERRPVEGGAPAAVNLGAGRV